MRNLVLIAIALFAVAVAAPQLLDLSNISRPERAAEETPIIVTPSRNRSTPSSNRSASRSDDVKIRAQADGHFYVDAKINGRNIDLVVDTGASMVALRESDARRAGIRLSRSDFNAPISTANGMAYAADVTLRRVSIGGINIRNVRGVVIPDERLRISLLGASFLNKLRRFEVSNNILVLED